MRLVIITKKYLKTKLFKAIGHFDLAVTHIDVKQSTT